MHKRIIIGSLVLIVMAACDPKPPAVIGQPGFCGQTLDGKAVVAMTNDIGNCPPVPGQKQIAVDELCGPIMPGSNMIDDCYKGAVAGIGPGFFRLGTLQLPGNVIWGFVASDATAV